MQLVAEYRQGPLLENRFFRFEVLMLSYRLGADFGRVIAMGALHPPCKAGSGKQCHAGRMPLERSFAETGKRHVGIIELTAGMV